MLRTDIMETLDSDHLTHLSERVANRLVQRALPPITMIDLFLTEACTLRCDYCFVSNKKQKSATWEVAKAAVDFLVAESRGEEDLEIIFFGGEPLLEFDLLRETAHYARACAAPLGKRVGFSVTTNLTIMTEEIAGFGRQNGFNYLISIDGDRTAHDLHRKTPSGGGSWDSVMGENFALLKRTQGWIGSRITVNPDTAHWLSGGVKDLFARGVNQFIIGPNMDVHWPPESLAALESEWHRVADFYLEEKGKGSPIRIAEFEETPESKRSACGRVWGCAAGRTRLAVSISGDLYPCARFVSADPCMEQYRLGSLRSGTSNIEARLRIMDQRDVVREKCAACADRAVCFGGCFAGNLHMSGSVHIPADIDCFITRVMMDILKKIHAEMSRVGGQTGGSNKDTGGASYAK